MIALFLVIVLALITVKLIGKAAPWLILLIVAGMAIQWVEKNWGCMTDSCVAEHKERGE